MIELTAKEITKVNNVRNWIKYNPKCSIKDACLLFGLEIEKYKECTEEKDFLSIFENLVNDIENLTNKK